MFVLGTAGHIDHGKSSLIKAMTGIDPDRLPEEKERGLTIDLGFAWLNLPGGDRVGLVDVPGHERFVRNMVAGAGGVNAAMLVVAADDGWMPQTQEHFDILRLLNIGYGLVAVTKTDLVDPDWLELIMADVEAKLSGSFLEGAPIIAVSSVTGEGVGTVVEAISNIAQKLRAVQDIGKTRLFVDRSFVLTGIGVVVTGTSRGGGFSADTDVYHFPKGERIRIRSLQSHEEKVERVGPGTRVAINLTGVDRGDIARGHTVTVFEYKLRPKFLAAWVTNLDNSSIALKEGRKVLVILGTTESEGVIRPFDDNGIKPGESGPAIIKTDEPLAAFVGDHFILRLPTPQMTVGGGTVLDLLDHYPRRKILPQLKDYLMRRRDGDLKELIRTELVKRVLTPEAGLLMYTNHSTEETQAVLDELVAGGEIDRFDGDLLLIEPVSELAGRIEAELDKIHKSASYLRGLTAEELARRLKTGDQEQFIQVLKYLESRSRLGRSRQFYHRPNFVPELDEQMQKQAERIMADAEKAAHNYLAIADIESAYPGSRKTLNFLIENGRLRVISSQFVMTETIWREIVAYVEEVFGNQGKFTVAEFRDRFGSSRKYALPVLENLDRLGITKRDGDYRIKGASFDERHSL